MADEKKTDDESKEEKAKPKKASASKSKKASSSKSKKSSASKSKSKKADDTKEVETDAKEAKKKPSRSRSRSRKKPEEGEAEAAEATAETADDAKEEKAAKSKSKKASSTKSKSGSKKSASSKSSGSKSKPKKSKKDDSSDESKPKSTDEVIAAATEFLGGVFERMGLQVKIVGKADDSTVSFDLQGEDAETLLGASKASPRSLDALQTIARGAITDGTGFHLNLDIGGFREKRTDRLQDVAQQLAAAAAKVEQPIVLAGFNSFERRVIHKTLENEKSVKTDSEGYGAFRKLRVEPN